MERDTLNLLSSVQFSYTFFGQNKIYRTADRGQYEQIINLNCNYNIIFKIEKKLPISNRLDFTSN